MVTRARRISMGFAAAAMAVAVWPAGGAGALAPDAVGYWVQAQTTQVPSPLPTIPNADPVVPKGGLYVANAVDGPKAVSALTYTVDGGVSATLELDVHSYTPPPPSDIPPPPQQPPSPNPSLMTIAACPADPWDVPPNGGGPGAWENRPRHSDDCVLGQFSGDGTRLVFDLGPDRQSTEGQFNLAIVPVPAVVQPGQPPVNRPFSVTFSPPREESLAPGPSDDGGGFDDGGDPGFDVFDPGTDFADDFPVLGPDVIAPGPILTTPTTAAPAPRPRVNLPRRATRPVVAVPGDDRGERMMAVALLMALATAWWWFGGQQSRGPVLLGSLGAEGRRPGRSAEPTGGIGRFARPRGPGVRPRRLL